MPSAAIVGSRQSIAVPGEVSHWVKGKRPISNREARKIVVATQRIPGRAQACQQRRRRRAWKRIPRHTAEGAGNCSTFGGLLGSISWPLAESLPRAWRVKRWQMSLRVHRGWRGFRWFAWRTIWLMHRWASHRTLSWQVAMVSDLQRQLSTT